MAAFAAYMGERFIAFAFFLAILICGAGLVVHAVGDFTAARASLAWPTVNGVVLEPRGGQTPYAYSWSGRTYFSTRRRFLTALQPGHLFEPDLAEGEFVRVYVSPQRPRQAVLQAGGSRLSFLGLIGFGAALTFVGGGGVAREFTYWVAHRHDHDKDQDQDQSSMAVGAASAAAAVSADHAAAGETPAREEANEATPPSVDARHASGEQVAPAPFEPVDQTPADADFAERLRAEVARKRESMSEDASVKEAAMTNGLGGSGDRAPTDDASTNPAAVEEHPVSDPPAVAIAAFGRKLDELEQVRTGPASFQPETSVQPDVTPDLGGKLEGTGAGDIDKDAINDAEVDKGLINLKDVD